MVNGNWLGGVVVTLRYYDFRLYDVIVSQCIMIMIVVDLKQISQILQTKKTQKDIWWFFFFFWFSKRIYFEGVFTVFGVRELISLPGEALPPPYVHDEKFYFFSC